LIRARVSDPSGPYRLASGRTRLEARVKMLRVGLIGGSEWPVELGPKAKKS
jgi:hypothetical protein